MARNPKRLSTSNFETPTTAALVKCTDWGFADMNVEPNPELLGCDIAIRFNGIADEVGSRIVVARNATLAQKQAAIRQRVNDFLAEAEPGNTLNNANIQIENLPQ
jgi:hypothetical protein